MFKIESYITPILMNHVAKYVKNIRPQDAQLSLWEGEALFTNLDLRLDVLERELNLPFELISGHIHELNIRVPWTKITSEPIKVTINTIEFVFKLRDPNTEPESPKKKLKPSPSELHLKKKSIVKQEEVPQQQTAYSALVNKIINNIIINCHNIILKYLEPEIIVSLNVQFLSYGSADDKWKISMVDINPVRVVTRKLITVSDLTICLDKRNAAGNIDVCQEPMLYRCTLECRILRKYNANTVSTTSITRIGIITKSLDVNVSSMQFPLLIRLILVFASMKGEESSPRSTIDSVTSSSEQLTDQMCPETKASYLSWAWNLLPSFNFEPFETEETLEVEFPGHTLDFGFYIEQLNFTLKNAEFVNDTIMGANKRIKYTPVMRTIFGGIYVEYISLEERPWTNFKTGITTICLEPMGACRTDDKCRDTIIESPSAEIGRPYIDKSLFDDNCLMNEKGWGVTSFDEYTHRITDEYLLYRSPIFAFDMIKYRPAKQADDTTDSSESSTPRYQYRFLSSGVTFRYTEAFVQVTNMIKDYISSYDYTAYYPERNVETPKMHPPLMEDYDALMLEIPLQSYKFRVLNLSFEVYPKLEPTDPATQQRIASNQKHVVPHFLFFIEEISGVLSTPLEPETLVHTTCQLPEKPPDLLDACYNNFRVNMENIYLTLCNKSSVFNKLLSIPKMKLNYSSLLQPAVWEEDEVPEHKFDFFCEEFAIAFSKRELVLIIRLFECIQVYDDYLLWKIIKHAWRPQSYGDTIKIQNQCSVFHKYVHCYKTHSLWNLSIKGILSEIICNRNVCDLPKYEILNATSTNNWFDFQAQFPRNPQNDTGTNVIGLWLENFNIYLDPHLLDFLNYQEEFVKTLEKEKIFDAEHAAQIELLQAKAAAAAAGTSTLPSNLITTQLQPNQNARRFSARSYLAGDRNTRRISHPQETIHLSSERDEKVDLEADSSSQFNPAEVVSYTYWLQFLKFLIMNIEIGQGKINIFKNEAITKEKFCMEIRLPEILIRSSYAEMIQRSDQEKLVLPPSVIIHKDTFNFSFSFNDLTVRSGTEDNMNDLLMPIHTNITIALTHKKERNKEKDSLVQSFEFAEKISVKSKPQPAAGPLPIQTKASTSTAASSVDSRKSLEIPVNNSSGNESSSDSLSKKEKKRDSLQKKKANLYDSITLNIHADTTPIVVFVSNEKFKLVKEPFSLLMNVWYSMQVIAIDVEDDVPIEPLQIITAAEDNASIKDFFELESNSGTTRLSDPSVPQLIAFAVFCQWTITKTILELEIVDQRKKHKCVLELEDLIVAIDKHSDFIKFTTKIGDMKFRYLEFIERDWRKNESIRIQVLAESSGAPHINFIYTIVTLKNYFKRIGAKQRGGDMNRSISEIIISVQFTEIILDLVKMSKFLEPWQMVSQDWIDYSSRRRKLQRESQSVGFYTATMLPMIHVDSKGFILYLPVETGKPLCSTAIAKIENIKVTNYLENPLQRNPVRMDVWSKASNLGMLGMPGAFIEDRQYEITFSNISAATGNWHEIKMHMYEVAHSFNRSNPAFEWNNPDRKTTLQFANFFTDFKFVIIFAPVIEYNNVCICGQAVEFNCASDFVSECTTAQMHLLGCLLASFWNISSALNKVLLKDQLNLNPAKSVSDSTIQTSNGSNIVLRNSNSWSSTQTLNSREKKRSTMYYECNASTSTAFKSVDEDNEKVVNSDSGFMSCEQNSFASCLSLSRCKIHSNEHFSSLPSNTSLLQEHIHFLEAPKRRVLEAPKRYIPHTVSLVAGIFIIKLFESKRSPDKHKEGEKLPLLSFTLTQPSFMISQSIYEYTTQMYLFNINVNMRSSRDLDDTPEKSEEKLEEEALADLPPVTANLFPYVLVETKLGKIGSTGIKPPIFRFKIHISKKNLKEVEVELCKPIALNLKEDHIECLCRCIVLIYNACLDNSCLKSPTIKRVVRDTKINLMRKQFFDADRIQLKLDKIHIKIFNEKDYNSKIILANTQANIKFITRPEKCVAKILVGAFYVRTDNKIFVHPINVRFSIDLVTEPWYSLPLVKSTAKFNVIQLDIGVYELRTLTRAFDGYNRVNVYIDAMLNVLFVSRLYSNPEDEHRRDSWLPIKCPTLVNKNKKQKQEFYQDDLRAGAFQFVEMTMDSFLPLPYQIQIIKKNFGIICWRYPQPRKMTRIRLFPVPMASPSPINIKCRMEYFSETHEKFIEYLEFCLSETVSRELELPQREICANIWRVVILQPVVSVNADCFDDNADDDARSIHTIQSEDVLRTIADNKRKTESGEAEFILHPRALVGCMRIDTAFQSECVPRVQLLVTINGIMLSFLNQPDEHVQLPSFLKKFKVATTTQISQTFLTFNVERINLFLVLNSLQKFYFNSEMAFHIKCIDYGFLNMVYLLEECRLQYYFNMNKITNTLTSSMILNKIALHFGPAILHTILSSRKHWDEFLKPPKYDKYAFVPKCIVVNRTHSLLSFGQTGTIERIPLKPRECYMYSFRSDYFNQELTFFIADDSSELIEASQPVPILLKFEEPTHLQYIRMGNKCIVIKSRRLSSSQIYILIKGQIEILSMVNFEFNLEICADNSLYGETKSKEYSVIKKSRATFFRSVQRNSNIAMRMKFTNIKGGKLRSGDIPLKSNKHLPWLVKVPQPNNQFISFWVRVLREDIQELTFEDFRPQKLLITIWPIFEIMSNLTVAVAAEEDTTKQQLALAPDGCHEPLNVPATHLSEHQLTFFYDFPITDDSKSKFLLSLKNLNWNKFFYYDEQKWTIEKALNELAKASRSKWPVMVENEWRIERVSLLTAPPTIMYKCAPTREFGCSLTLEVTPWGLFINASGILASVYDPDTQDALHIESNCMEMMPAIDGVFILKVQNGSNWYDSLPIYFDGAMDQSVEKYYVLQEGVPIDVTMLCGLDVTMFVLEMRFENSRRIFLLNAKYCVTNFTKMKLCLMPFAMGHKEVTARHDIKFLDTQVRKKYILPVQSLENCIGFSLDSFHDINFRKAERNADTIYTCFVCIKVCDDSDISLPIPLATPFTRRCFSISNDGESIPLVTTLIEKDGILYLNVFEDQRPAILLNNQTDIKLFVAQTKAAENTNVSKVSSEYAGSHFKWYQLLPAYSKVYYTPPDMSVNFPEVESTVCNLTLAIYTDHIGKRNIRWSRPIRTDKTWEKFLNIPSFGDVRLVVCDQHKIIRVTIYYIAEPLEFSVKDLRSRLSCAPSEELLKLPDVVEDEFEDELSEHQLYPVAKEVPKPTPKCIHFRDDCGKKLSIKVRCLIKEISFSLKMDSKIQDYRKIELMAISVDDLAVALDADDDQRQIQVILPNLQIDNQLYTSGHFDFPVVLCSEEVYVANPILPHIHKLHDVVDELLKTTKPMALFNVNLYDDEFVIRSLVCSISPIRIYIEDSYLAKLLDALVECEPSNCIYDPQTEWERVVLKNDQILLPKDIVAQAIYVSDPMKLQSFRIQPLSVLLSVHTSVRLYIALDHSPLSFSAYEKNQIYTVPLRFGQSVGMHYLSGAIFGAGWVVGSLEILGSPSCLARSFSTGLRDFVSMPVQGLFRGPWGFVVGFTQGSASLLRNVTAGTVNSVTKLAASVARNLDRLSLDAEHIERTEALRRSRPQGFTEGFSNGITGLGISILGAVGGLARHTLEARTPVEVMTGVGKGIVGAFTKPISGAVELVALAGQGMLQTVGFNAMPSQKTPPMELTISVEPSAYRIWKLLPGVLVSDQILFYQEVMLVVKDQLRKGYAFLTSAVFAIMESQWDKLSFVYPADKVELFIDQNDRTLVHVRRIRDGDEIDENEIYVQQRIMNFLQTSSTSINLQGHLTNDSLTDILMGAQEEQKVYLDWSFYIAEHMGQYLVEYLKIINNRID